LTEWRGFAAMLPGCLRSSAFISRIERTLDSPMEAVRRKPPGVLCTRFKSIKNVELIGNNEVVGIELLTEWGDFAAMLPGCLRSSA
jgi:hypothetical protein